ncbi:transcriptional regulator, partial [Listeria monocytogenes]
MVYTKTKSQGGIQMLTLSTGEIAQLFQISKYKI